MQVTRCNNIPIANYRIVYYLYNIRLCFIIKNWLINTTSSVYLEYIMMNYILYNINIKCINHH